MTETETKTDFEEQFPRKYTERDINFDFRDSGEVWLWVDEDRVCISLTLQDIFNMKHSMRQLWLVEIASTVLDDVFGTDEDAFHDGIRTLKQQADLAHQMQFIASVYHNNPVTEEEALVALQELIGAHESRLD